MTWGGARGLKITPFGIDQGRSLIELARRRLPRFAAYFQVANAWNWHPPRRYEYVYALWDCVPGDYLTEFVRRLLARFVAPGGYLIVGAYGSLSRNQQAFDVETFLKSARHRLKGSAGTPPVARFAWIRREG